MVTFLPIGAVHFKGRFEFYEIGHRRSGSYCQAIRPALMPKQFARCCAASRCVHARYSQRQPFR